jgi:hypothetical protein
MRNNLPIPSKNDPISHERAVKALLAPARPQKIRHRAEEILRGKQYTEGQLRAEFNKFFTREWIVRDLLILQKNKDKWINFITLTWFTLSVGLNI